MESNRKRVTIKPKHPNPLFEKWLEEWKNEAASRGSDMQYCFAKALISLKKYPLCLKSGKECGILRNFGNRLCIMLDRKLAEYRKTHPEEKLVEICAIETQEIQKPAEKKRPKAKTEKPNTSPKKNTAVNRNKKYIPAWRSGPYALLLTLLSCSEEPGYPGYMGKDELQTRAQHLCDTSFKKPLPGSHYTAWSSMTSLIKKQLVSRSGCPARFSLTAEGEDLAKKLQTIHNDMSSEKQHEETDSSNHAFPVVSTSTGEESLSLSVKPKIGQKMSPQKQKEKIYSSNPVHDTQILLPGSFDVKLLIDTQETAGYSKNGNISESVAYFKEHGVLFEVCHLKVGDFAWVCCDKSTNFSTVLPYIVERKRIDDFAKSITDGRFHEQKFRLKQCGIPNLIYLVESYGRDPHTVLPLKTINQAAVNTQVVDGFSVKYTYNLRESVAYLATLTHLFSKLFQNKTIVSCSKNDLPPVNINEDLISLMTFDEFNKSSGKTKNFQVSEMFVKQLLQLHGLSVEKALAIVEQFPTPRKLMAMYQNGAKENLLADISHGSLGRLLGPVISKALYQFYSSTTLM